MTVVNEIPDDENDAELKAADLQETEDAQDQDNDGAPGDAPAEPITAADEGKTVISPPMRSANIGHH